LERGVSPGNLGLKVPQNLLVCKFTMAEMYCERKQNSICQLGIIEQMARPPDPHSYPTALNDLPPPMQIYKTYSSLLSSKVPMLLFKNNCWKQL